MQLHKIKTGSDTTMSETQASTAANIHHWIKNSDGYPVYITDDTTAAFAVYESDKLQLFDINELEKDPEGLSTWFCKGKYKEQSCSPVIFALTDRSNHQDIISTFVNADIVTYCQNLDKDFTPIVSNSPEDIENQIHQQYQARYSTAAYIDELKEVITSRANTPSISTGFPELDSVLGGGLHEGIIAVGAETSSGKTTFCMQIADHIAKSGKDVLVFSLEMSKYELMSKSISRITYERVKAENKPIQHAKTQLGITDGSRYLRYSHDEIKLIYSSIDEYKQGIAQGLYIYESVADMTVDDIALRIEEYYQNTKRYPVVIIDYLQLLQHPDKYINASDKQRTDTNVTSLKRLSRDKKIPIIAISSFNRTSYDKDITLAAFKESGAIEYSSDVVLGLKVEQERTLSGSSNITARDIKLSVLKNRQGCKGVEINFTYVPQFNHYTEHARDDISVQRARVR